LVFLAGRGKAPIRLFATRILSLLKECARLARFERDQSLLLPERGGEGRAALRSKKKKGLER